MNIFYFDKYFIVFKILIIFFIIYATKRKGHFSINYNIKHIYKRGICKKKSLDDQIIIYYNKCI